MSPSVELRARTLAIVALNALTLGVLAGVLAFPDARRQLFHSNDQLQHAGTASIGGRFQLTSHTGAIVADDDFRGRLMLVTFGLTGEPDLTSPTQQLLAAALARLGARSERVACLFITLDPLYDTPAKLKEYLAKFDSRLIGLTGSPDQIAAIAKAYRVPFERIVDSAAPSQATIAFEPLIYLMNQRGEYVTHLSQGLTVEALIHAIEQVL